MNRQDVFEWAKRQYDTELDYMWKDWNNVLRRKKNNK